MKQIERYWMYDKDLTETIQGKATFIATGKTDKGKLFYGMIDKNGNLHPKHNVPFIQIRHKHNLVMVRI